MKYETFWMVRKNNGVSKIEKQTTNPIKSSYDLLWGEVRKMDRFNHTIQNVLRRILEGYFKVLGGVDEKEICARFEGAESIVCRSLFSWINDGSHSIHDDLHMSLDEQEVARYLTVFQQIFVTLGHKAHYDMMMGESVVDETAETAAA